VVSRESTRRDDKEKVVDGGKEDKASSRSSELASSLESFGILSRACNESEFHSIPYSRGDGR
jgi:hypothetical protein